MTLRVYGASTLDHAQFWLTLRQQWREVIWTARWPKLVLEGTFKDEFLNPASVYNTIWSLDHADITAAEVVMLYADGSDNLRGALVEAGIALGQGKMVLLVGHNSGFGTWRHHPKVAHASDLNGARLVLKALNFSKEPWDPAVVAPEPPKSHLPDQGTLLREGFVTGQPWGLDFYPNPLDPKNKKPSC